MIDPFEFPEDLSTPCLVVDVDRLNRNIDHYARVLRERQVALRPHAKTHKSSHIAAMQLRAGATGLTVATLDEAEAFLGSGVSDVFVAYTTWVDADKARRLHRLLDQGVKMTVGVDSTDSIAQIGRMMSGAGDAFGVSIEIDSGAHRCGVRPEDAGRLADAVARSGLRLVGAYTHGGHVYDGQSQAIAAAEDERSALQVARQSIRVGGHEVPTSSAGSSPTALLSSSAPVNEERPGGYVFGDLIQVALGTCSPADLALMVVSTVVSAAVDGQVVIDAGSKSLGREASALVPGLGGVAGYDSAVLTKLSEEHGVIDVRGSRAPSVGEVLAIVPNHTCPAVNLFSEMVVVQGGKVVDAWPIDARSNPARTTSRA